MKSQARYRFENLYNYPVKRYFVMLVIIFCGHLMFFWLFNILPVFGRLAYKIFVAIGVLVLSIEALMLYVIVRDRSVKEVIIDLKEGKLYLYYKSGLEIRRVLLEPSDIESVELRKEGRNTYLRLITRKGAFTITTRYNQYTEKEVLEIYRLIRELKTTSR